MPADAVPALLRRALASAGSVGSAGGAGSEVVDDSSRRRAEYSSDASNYRVVPTAVVFPRSIDEVLAVAEVCRETRTPLTARGAGTSVAGNAVGPGVVVDFSRHLRGGITVDPQARTARVPPGAVLDDLQAAARPHGLRFGPDPSTHSRCTVGGMIGNNACGPHSMAYGKTSDNVLALDLLDGTGRRFEAARDLDVVPGLRDLTDANLSVFRTELGRFGRQVSGYSLDHLLPERGGDLAKALVGTEGTCGLVLGATLRLVELARSPALLVLGYPDLATAADAVPALLAHRPLAIEGIDVRIVDVVGARVNAGAAPIPELPAGRGLLFVEVTDSEAAAALAADAGTTAMRLVPAGPEAAALWRIREDGAGLAGRINGAQAWPGWEDAAVPPEHLGSYLRDFAALLRNYGVDGLAYGHFGDGCVHVRLDLPLAQRPVPQRRAGGPGGLRPFLTDAARLVASYGGSLSGEHGDGRARSELLPLMYSAEAIAAFGRFRSLFDPDGLLNPGVVVAPVPVDADLRRPAARPTLLKTGFALSEDSGDLTRAVHRCVGVGKCRATPAPDGAGSGSSPAFMCPSYVATRDERDSTRGRARVLQEMANGGLVRDGWRSPEVHDVLDLCLSCKACASDCPAGVDMATYKSQVLHETYRPRGWRARLGLPRLRPRAHYALGQLPRWTGLVAALPPGLVAGANVALAFGPLRRVLLRAGGMDPRRGVPRLAARRFDRSLPPVPTGNASPPVLLWLDSFTEAFAPEVARAAVEVLGAAGYSVRFPPGSPCCGLTWITTGQLDGARKRLTDLVERLAPYAEAGIPILGLEPSCVAVLRSDLVELLPNDPRAELVAGATVTLAELLARPLPDPGFADRVRLDDLRLIAQPHCHQHAVMSYAADRALLAAGGAQVRELTGCCGLAGNFGMEQGHYDVSVAIAEAQLLPALRSAEPGTVLLADGFSCRTQAADLGAAEGAPPARHLAELLAEALRRNSREVSDATDVNDG